MKRFTIAYKYVGTENLDLLENASSNMDIIEDENAFFLCDMVTGLRILAARDILAFDLSDEQETLLKLKFGDKIQELV